MQCPCCAEFKGHCQVVGAIVCTLGRHVEHAFHAVDLLLNRCCYRFGNRNCVTTWINRQNGHGGWRLQGTWQRAVAERNESRNHNHDGNDCCEDVMDKETRHLMLISGLQSNEGGPVASQTN